MAWLYILILLVMITLEIVWGVLSVAAFNNDKFPVDNDQIQNDINGVFTGTAIDGFKQNSKFRTSFRLEARCE